MKKLLIIQLVATALIGCSKPALNEFYFQMEDFSESKTYVFIDQNNAGSEIHFNMYYQLIDSDTIFISETLSPDGTIQDVFVEKINGSICALTDYYTYALDSKGVHEKQSYEIIEAGVYSYKYDDYPLTWKIKTGEGNNVQFVTKTRSILNEKSTIKVLNELKNCIVFKDKFTIEEQNGLFKFYQESYYAKGLGLVAYERFVDDNSVMHFKLQEIK